MKLSTTIVIVLITAIGFTAVGWGLANSFSGPTIAKLELKVNHLGAKRMELENYRDEHRIHTGNAVIIGLGELQAPDTIEAQGRFPEVGTVAMFAGPYGDRIDFKTKILGHLKPELGELVVAYTCPDKSRWVASPLAVVQGKHVQLCPPITKILDR